MPTVSVLIPIYNNAATLRRCLDSVFSQTLGGLEVICVDDGSIDGSGAMLDEYAAAHGNMSVVHQTNHGEAASRNRAIEMAQGEFVAHMDGDDRYYDEHALQVLYEAAKTQGVNAVGGAAYLLDERGNLTLLRDEWEKSAPEQAELVAYGDHPVIMGHWCFIYDRNMIMAHHIRYSPRTVGCDLYFLARALATAEQFYLTLTPVYLYSLDSSIKRSWLTPKGLLDFWGAWLDLLDIAREFGLPTLRDKVHYNMRAASVAYRLMTYRHLVEGESELAEMWARVVQATSGEPGYEALMFLSDVGEMRADLRRYAAQVRQLRTARRIVIYGAGQVGQRMGQHIGKLFAPTLDGFCVSAQQPHEPAVLGLPVRTVDELPRDTLVIVGVGRQYAPEVRANLQRLGFTHVLEFARMSLSFLEVFCQYPEILSGLIDEEGVQCPR